MLVSHRVGPQLWLSRALQGRSWGKLCLFPQLHVPQAGLAAPMSLGMLLGLGLCCGARAEIVDGAFSLGAKAHNTFLLVPCGISCRQLPSCAAGHWHGLHWSLEPQQGGEALPRASQLLIQQEKFNDLMGFPFEDRDARWRLAPALLQFS